MKRIVKPFDLEQAKNGALIETRAGKKARLICTDCKGFCPVVVAITIDNDDDAEFAYNYKVTGLVCTDRQTENDLVIVEYKEQAD